VTRKHGRGIKWFKLKGTRKYNWGKKSDEKVKNTGLRKLCERKRRINKRR
jgi:hypothetical protein